MSFIDAQRIVSVPTSDLCLAFAKSVGTTWYDAFGHWNINETRTGETIPGPGERFKLFTWDLENDTPCEEIDEVMRQQDVFGHTAAFIAWWLENRPSELNRVRRATALPMQARRYIYEDRVPGYYTPAIEYCAWSRGYRIHMVHHQARVRRHYTIAAFKKL